MDDQQRATLKRRSQQLEFSLFVLNRGDWPIVNLWGDGGPRDLAWLMLELWQETDGHRCPIWCPDPDDLMAEEVADALHLPHEPGNGLTFSWGLRLIRQRLNRLTGPAPRRA
jgi:hypothetical protein